MARYVFGVKIDLNGTYTQDTSIGLYTDAESGVVTSQIRLITNAVTTTWPYAEHLLMTDRPFDDVQETSDYRRGGNVSQQNNCGVSINNSGKFWKKIQDLGITLQGMKCKIIRFNCSTSPATETQEFSGVGANPVWDETVYRLEIVQSQYKRKANIMTQKSDVGTTSQQLTQTSSDNIIIPATFGYMPRAKFVNTKVVEDTFIAPGPLSTFDFGTNGAGQHMVAKFNCAPYNKKIFPVIGRLPVNPFDVTKPLALNVYKIELGWSGLQGLNYWIQWYRNGTEVYGGTYDLQWFIDKYMYVVTGPGEGEYRRITGAKVTAGATCGNLTIQVESVFSHLLMGPIQYIGPLPATVGAGSINVPDSNQFNIGDWGLLSDTSGVSHQQNIYVTGKPGSYTISIYGTLSSTYDPAYYASIRIGALTTGITAGMDTMCNTPSWVSFCTVMKDYQADVWPCTAFLDDSLNPLTTDCANRGELKLYAYDQKSKITVDTTGSPIPLNQSMAEYLPIPYYAYAADTVDGSNNKIHVGVNMYNGNVDNIDGFFTFPIPGGIGDELNLPLNTLKTWEVAGDAVNMNLYSRTGPYLFGQLPAQSPGSDSNFSGVLNVGDKSRTTWSTSHVQGTNALYGTYDYYRVVGFNFPAIPADIDFNEMYIGVNLKSRWQCNSGAAPIPALNEFRIRAKRWSGRAIDLHQCDSTDFGDHNYPGYYQAVDNLPDFYYHNDMTSTNNESFYYERTDGEALTDKTWSGYANFKCPGINNADQYNSLQRGVLMWKRKQTGPEVGGYIEDIAISEIAMIFKKSMSVKDAIYSPFAGRRYESTWGGRKNPADCIANPVDLMEHVLRLQNWSETGDNTSVPGQQYSPAALINTDGTAIEGSLDYAALDPLRYKYYNGGRAISGQLVRYDDGWTDKLMQRLCKDFFVSSYQDSSGRECLTPVWPIKPTGDGSDVTAWFPHIDLTDIVGPISQLTEQKPEDVFCQPYVQYSYNQASQKFDGLINILSVQADQWDASYVTGVPALADASALWSRSHCLYNFYKQIEQPPSEMTDKYWITDPVMAVQYLYSWQSYMGVYDMSTADGTGYYEIRPPRWLSFDVPYEIGNLYHTGKHFWLDLPFQTDKTSIQCITEKVTRKLGNEDGLINLTAMITGVPSKLGYYIQDTIQHQNEIGWVGLQDTTQNIAPIQDSFLTP